MNPKTPKSGETILFLQIIGGKVARSEITVNPRDGFKLTDDEWSGSDGCRHNVANLWPCPARATAKECVLSHSTGCRPWLYCRPEDEKAATAQLTNDAHTALLDAIVRANALLDALREELNVAHALTQAVEKA